MKVLIIHQHFRTPAQGGAIRSYYLAKALLDQGIGVEVITGGNDKQYSRQSVEGIPVHYLPVAYDNKFGFWKRSNAFLSFTWRAAKLAGDIGHVDLCYTISVPLTTGITAWWLKRSRRIPFIFEVGDLWPDAPIELGFLKSVLLKKSLLRLERFIYRQATLIVALSEPIKAAIERKVSGRQVHVITNMSDTSFFGSPGDHAPFRSRHQVTDKFVVSYIGAVGYANGLDHLVEGARSAQQAGLNVHFFICGEGALLDQHKANVKRLQLSNITFLPFTDRNGVKELMDATDAVFVCYKPFRILETGSPNKYFDGLAAGKLIIINFGGWIREEIEREKCGVYIDRQQPERFATIVRPFIDDKRMLGQYQAAAKDLALRRYERKLLTGQFIELIRSHRV